MQDPIIPEATGIPDVTGFFDKATNTISYVVKDPASKSCALVDSVLNFDVASGRTSMAAANKLLDHVAQHDLKVEWILETHVHADHLSAAPYLREKTSAKIGIGSRITEVQEIFGKVFNAGSDFQLDGSQFDRLFEDGDRFSVGSLGVKSIHTPGHTPACITYVMGPAAFVGDTLFMPDFGTARTDFPGGDAKELYQSIWKILDLAPETKLFMCHDYKAPGRDNYQWENTVAEQRSNNIHIHEGVSVEDFTKFRRERDATLSPPKLLFPSVQTNMRAGDLPPAENNGVSYLKIPINRG